MGVKVWWQSEMLRGQVHRSSPLDKLYSNDHSPITHLQILHLVHFNPTPPQSYPLTTCERHRLAEVGHDALGTQTSPGHLQFLRILRTTSLQKWGDLDTQS